MSLTLEQWLGLLTFGTVILMLLFRAGVWTRSVENPRSTEELKRIRDRLHALANSIQRIEVQIDALAVRVARDEQDIQKLFNGSKR